MLDDRLLPLAPSQEARLRHDLIWMGERPLSAPPHQTACVALRLLGSLDEGSLVSSLRLVLQRQEGLRARFRRRGDEWLQRIAPTDELEIAAADLRTLPALEREAAVSAIVRAEADLPFDLVGGGAPLRVRLLTLGDHEHVLVLTADCIVFDGWWSQMVLMGELSAGYNAAVRGQQAALEDLEFGYADLIAWLRGHASGPSLESLLGYWRRQLAGGTPAPELRLPNAPPRPQHPAYLAARQSVTLSGNLSRALRQLARQRRVTLFMLLLAAVQVLVARHTGNDDVSVLAPMANRPLPEAEHVIGPCANLVALRTDLSGDPTFAEAMQRARGVVLDAQAHQELAFDELVRALAPDRYARPWTVPVVVLTLLDPSPSLPRLNGLEVVPVEIPIIKADSVGIWVVDRDEIGLVLEYEADWLTAAIAVRLLDDLVELLQTVAQDPTTRLARLTFVPLPTV